jgi:hypothetical protein
MNATKECKVIEMGGEIGRIGRNDWMIRKERKRGE